MKQEILNCLSAACPWRDTLHWYDTIPSTNTHAKELAKAGAPHGTVLIAGSQTGGRGRMGRSFQSPAGQGVYLSVILRPNCPPSDLMHLTCATAVAMCHAVEAATSLRPGIKWTNDMVFGRKKLGGILTELSVDTQSGLTEFAVVGIGLNCCQHPEDFPPELQDMAISASMAAGRPIAPSLLAAEMIHALVQMDRTLLTEKQEMLDFYRANCITLGQDVVIVRGDERHYGTALDIDPEGGLLVAFADGHRQVVSSGEVSVRGMYGYI